MNKSALVGILFWLSKDEETNGRKRRVGRESITTHTDHHDNAFLTLNNNNLTDTLRKNLTFDSLGVRWKCVGHNVEFSTRNKHCKHIRTNSIKINTQGNRQRERSETNSEASYFILGSYFFVFSQLKLSVCAELQRRAMTSARRSINGNCRTRRPSPPCQTLSPGWTPRHDAVNFVSCVGRYASLVSGKPGALSLTCSFALRLEWNTSSSDA